MYVHDARTSKPRGGKKLNIIVLLYYSDIISPRLLLILMYFDLQYGLVCRLPMMLSIALITRLYDG